MNQPNQAPSIGTKPAKPNKPIIVSITSVLGAILGGILLLFSPFAGLMLDSSPIIFLTMIIIGLILIIVSWSLSNMKKWAVHTFIILLIFGSIMILSSYITVTIHEIKGASINWSSIIFSFIFQIIYVIVITTIPILLARYLWKIRQQFS